MERVLSSYEESRPLSAPSENDPNGEVELLLQPQRGPISLDQLVFEVRTIYELVVLLEDEAVHLDEEGTIHPRVEPSRRAPRNKDEWMSDNITRCKALLHQYHDLIQTESMSPATFANFLRYGYFDYELAKEHPIHRSEPADEENRSNSLFGYFCPLSSFNGTSPQEAFIDSGSSVNTITESFALECNLTIDASFARKFLLADNSVCESLGNVRAVLELPDGSFVTESFSVLRDAVHKIVLGSRAIRDYASVWTSKIGRYFSNTFRRGALAGLHALNGVQESWLNLRKKWWKRQEPANKNPESARHLVLALRQLDDNERDRRQRYDGPYPDLSIIVYELERDEMWLKLAGIDPGLASHVNEPI